MSSFVKIEGYSRYVINKDGVVINTVRKRRLKASKNNSGYLNVRITDDGGTCHTWGLHRLLGWVYLAKFGDITGKVINHLDGNKLNNNLDNLEITTYQGNVEHAGRENLSEKCKLVSIRHFRTGSVRTFPSILAASKVLGLSKDVVSARCSKGEDHIYPDGYQYKLGWGKFKDLDVPCLEDAVSYGRRQRLYIRFVLTGEIKSFDSASDLASFLDVSDACISTWLKVKDQPVLKKFIQVQLAKDLTNWVDHNDPISSYENFNKTRCVYVWDKDGNCNLYSTAKEAGASIGLNATAISYRLSKKGKTTFKDGTRCCYYTDWSPLVETLEG